jgi:P27 family predicted phage terminase small subunit
MTKKRQNKPSGRPKKPKTPPVLPPIKPVDAVPRAPSWLSKPAKQEWRRSAAQLAERKTLTTGDLAALETFCSAKGRLVLAEALLQRDGLTSRGANGVITKHPAIGIASEASSIIKTLAAALGLTPASRRRAATENTTPKAGNVWEGLIDG